MNMNIFELIGWLMFLFCFWKAWTAPNTKGQHDWIVNCVLCLVIILLATV